MGVATVYCADGNPAFARIAVECGWLYGARLPATVYERVWFADQDWKRPDRAAYMKALALHRPEVATVLDWEREDQWPEVLSWAEEAAQYVRRVVIIPKVVDAVCRVPGRVGGADVVLGFSVPTAYGGTPCPAWEFRGRPVHLLGGSPQRQMFVAQHLNVVSADGNMAALMARRGRTWLRRPTRKGHWNQLADLGDTRTDPAAECFRRSLLEIGAAWANI